MWESTLQQNAENLNDQGNDDSGGDDRPELEKVLDVLKGEPDQRPAGDDQAGNDGEPPGAGDDQQKAPATLADVAERLQMPVETLFDLKLKLDGDGEEISLSDAKHAASEQHRHEMAVLQFEKEMSDKRGEFLKAQNMLKDVLSLIPQNLMPKNLIDKIRTSQTEAVERERAATLSTIVEWSDEAVETKDREMMSKHLEKAGYSADYLDQVVDHVTLNYIRTNALREQRIEAAIAKFNVKKPAAQKPSQRRAGQHKAPAKKPGKGGRAESEQQAAITDLLIKG